MGLFKRLQGWAPRMEWKPCNSLLRNPHNPSWPQHSVVLGRFQGTGGRSLFCCQPEKLHPHASSQGCQSQQDQKATTSKPLERKHLPETPWCCQSWCGVLAGPEDSPPGARYGSRVCRTGAVSLQACEHSSVPTARATMHVHGWAVEGTIPLGTTDFTLHGKALPLPLPLCSRPCQSCRQQIKDAGAMPAMGDKEDRKSVV